MCQLKQEYSSSAFALSLCYILWWCPLWRDLGTHSFPSNFFSFILSVMKTSNSQSAWFLKTEWHWDEWKPLVMKYPENSGHTAIPWLWKLLIDRKIMLVKGQSGLQRELCLPR